jgi:hypothetical protein
MFHHLTACSRNVKTGPIPVSTSDQDSCPDSCSIKKACYASTGPLCIHWKKMSNGKNNAVGFNEFIQKIKALPPAQFWRHNQAGDLIGNSDDSICAYSLDQLIEANKGKAGFTYTHYPVLPEQYKGNEPNKANEITEFNKLCIKQANEQGFTINASGDNLKQAEKLHALGLPTVAIIPENAPIKGKTENGTPYIACPAQVFEGKNCANCKLCQKSTRKQIIGFYVHGSRKKNWSE